jgi:DNA-binding beta-propeller fold protein YncE
MKRFLFTCLGALTLAATTMRADRVELVAGGAEEAAGIPAVRAKLHEPFGVEFNAAGEMFIVEMAAGNRLLKVDTSGRLTHIAGQRDVGDEGDGGPALAAKFNGPHNLAVLTSGDVLISDTWNGRVRRVEVAAGRVTTLPGFQVASEKARSGGPYHIALTPDKRRLLVSDLRRVHAVDLATGTVRVLAGNGEKGIPTDGALATESPLVDPRAAVMDRHGNLYILERNGHALRVVDSAGRIRTAVNVAGRKGSAGDGGDAKLAQLNGPKHLCLDANDDVIIADAENNVVRRYEVRTGKIIRIAGTGKKGATGVGGPSLACELARPHGVTIGPDGALYITDSYNDRVLRVSR